VQDWVYADREGGIERLLPGKSPGRPTKLPREREAEFAGRLEAGPRPEDGVCTLRGKDVILEREFGVSYSLDGVYDLLERLDSPA
jgi:transposase